MNGVPADVLCGHGLDVDDCDVCRPIPRSGAEAQRTGKVVEYADWMRDRMAKTCSPSQADEHRRAIIARWATTGQCEQCGTRVPLDAEGRITGHKAPRARKFCLGGHGRPRKDSLR